LGRPFWTMRFERALFGGRPCDLPGLCLEHVSVCVVRPRVLRPCLLRGRCVVGVVRWSGRAIGLDVHREFCEVAICEDGVVRSAGRVKTTPEALRMLAGSLIPTDRVALEVTGGVGGRADPRAARAEGDRRLT
jgi:hypothetical protein